MHITLSDAAHGDPGAHANFINHLSGCYVEVKTATNTYEGYISRADEEHLVLDSEEDYNAHVIPIMDVKEVIYQ